MLYVGEFTNYVKQIKDGVVTTLAGGIKLNHVNTAFKYPMGLAVNAQREIIVADYGKNQILKIGANNEVTVIAGTGEAGAADGTSTEATFNAPQGIAIDKNGNIYVADRGNHKIRKIASSGVVTTVAGTGQQGQFNGSGTSSTFNEPSGVAIDLDGNLLVADRGNHMIRKITFSK